MSKVSSTRRLVSASALMASGTLVSRMLGLVRVMLIAFIFANGTRQADMLAVATTVPNSLYILFAGGALNTVLVPQIVRAIKNDEDGGEAYTNRIMTAFMLIVAVVAVVVTIATPVVTMMYSSDAWRAPELAEQYASLVALTYLTLPQIFFYGAFFLLGQVLNARDKFGPMMWAPIANNVISIAVLGLYLLVWGSDQNTGAAFTTGQILLLGIGSTVGIAAQSLVLLPYLRKVGFRFRPRFDLKGTGLGKTFSLTKWTIGFVAVNQVALLVVTRLATSATAAGSGAGIDVYNKAHLIWILPHSLVTVSLATAMLPSASRLAAAGKLGGVAEEATRTMRLALVVLVPAAVGFFVLAEPIASLFFGQGQGQADSAWVGWALMGFAVGLIPFTVQFICLRTYYALEDTRTPFLLQFLIAGANAGLAIVFVWLVKEPGLVAAALGLAYSLAYLIGVFASWNVLSRRLTELNGGAIVMHVVRLLLGALLGGVAAWFLTRWLTSALGDGVFGPAVAILAGLVVLGGIYLVVARLLQVREFTDLSGLLASMRRRGKSAPAKAAAPKGEDTEPSTLRRHEVEEPKVVIGQDEYSAGGIAGGLTEDLMPTQLTPAVTEGLDPENFDAEFRRPDVEPPAELDGFADDMDDDEVGVFEEFGDFDDDVLDAAVEPAEPPAMEQHLDAESLLETQLRPGGLLPTAAAAFDDVDTDDVLLTPSPSEPTDDTDSSDATVLGEAGILLNTRYRLEELIGTRGWIEWWRAHDSVLSRDVVAHVIAEGDPRTHELVESARAASAATDYRFLRVLDAVATHEVPGIGAYIISEHTEGPTLTQVLGFGPLSALESAWLVRELADALTGMHAQGLFHEHLNPDNVHLTPGGDVKLAGFGVESVMSNERGESWSVREEADVKGLGKLLYATLVQRWPGGAAHGLEAAPIIAGEPASPHIVRTGVSPALDRIAAATLTERGAPIERRIISAAQLQSALERVLGTANASSDLEERVRLTLASTPRRAVPAPDNPARLSAVALATTSRNPVADPLNPPQPQMPEPAFADDAAGEEFGTEPAHDETGRRGLWLLVALVVGALVVSLIIVAVNNARDNGTEPAPGTTTSAGSDPSDSTSPSETAPGGVLEIVAGIDFDPEANGGNDEENPDLVPLAFDGDPATGWPTLRYHNDPNFGRLKPGVGLILDLGDVHTISSVDLLFETAGSNVEIRVPADEAVASAPMTSEAEWRIVGTQDAVPTEATLAVEAGTTSRYVMVYITSLPPTDEAARFLAQINEVTIKG